MPVRAAAARAGTETVPDVAKQNYRQAKRQKELARKSRQQEKQQKRATRPDEAPADGAGHATPDPTQS